MCFGGGGSSTPVVPPVPPAPTTESAASKGAAKQAVYGATQKEVTAAKQRQGRASTILTGPSGLTNEADIKKKTLLGQ